MIFRRAGNLHLIERNLAPKCNLCNRESVEGFDSLYKIPETSQ